MANIELSPEHEQALTSSASSPEQLQRLGLQMQLAHVEQQVQNGTIGAKMKRAGKLLIGPILGGAASLAIGPAASLISGPGTSSLLGTIGSGIASVAGSVASVIPSSTAMTVGGVVAGSAATRLLVGSPAKQAATAVNQSKIDRLRAQIDTLDGGQVQQSSVAPAAPVAQPAAVPTAIPYGIPVPNSRNARRVRRAPLSPTQQAAINGGSVS